VRQFDQSLKVTNATLVKVPFDLDHWTKVAAEKYPHGLPKPYTDDPTQWIFHGHPCGSVIWDEEKKWIARGPQRTNASVLQVAVARLLGYRWPAENDPDMELADEQREWVERAKTLYPFEDKDGIVCIPSVRGERPAAECLLELLRAAYGDEWHDSILTKLLSEAGGQSLDDWLRNHFFEQHCKLFHHRPFVWHIWDGRKRDGFHVLVNYHKLAEGDGKGRRLLESLTYSYLGDWIARQEDGVKRGEGGAEDRLAAALELQKRLVAILEGEPPFDIFVRWKPIEEQPIGWEPDIDDGVRLNIRPFMARDISGGKKGASILRAKPNTKWSKDRGKEPMREQGQFPWFWNDGKFTGDRGNDVHFANAEKRAAPGDAGNQRRESYCQCQHSRWHSFQSLPAAIQERAGDLMARADLLVDLVRAGTRGDQTQFRKVLEALIADDRAKQHNILADRLATHLQGNGGASLSALTSRQAAVFGDLFYEMVPRRRLGTCCCLRA
jgi:hypothetical protein